MFAETLVLGAGSAGLLAAITLKRKIPAMSVRVIRSPEIGIIGVGESTTPNLPYHLFEYLKLSPRRFYELARPTWKMGIRYLWGPRPFFFYTFEPQLDVRVVELPRPNGYYCDDDFTYANLQASLALHDKAFARQPNGIGPDIRPWHAFHLENPKLVSALEVLCLEQGVQIIDGTMSGAEPGPDGIAAINLQDGRRFTADLYIDASGFRSELLGKFMQEPFLSYSSSLFNDRACLGNWERTDELILPYTTAETMNSGWSWRIEHERMINRGYVYCSSMISDEQARDEFAAKNPKAKIADRVVKFRCGRYQRAWAGNVMAVGNSCGFVEPLESTALMVVCGQCETFVELITRAGITPGIRDLFNEEIAITWDEIRDFLSLHFLANTRLDTPYWRHCRNDTDVSGLNDLLEFYSENGPTGFSRSLLKNPKSQFGIEGFLCMLVGNKVSYENHHTPSATELQLLNRRRAYLRSTAQNGLDVKQALSVIRHPSWRWHGEN